MIALSAATQVGEIAASLPGAAELFRKAGISFCCGGRLSVAEAAERAGCAPADLLADLDALVAEAGRKAPDATPALIDHILTRYHDTHRTELDWLIPLARKVETVHGDTDDAPLGLSAALTELDDELRDHMAKEEEVLFPLMRQGGHPMIAHPIARMRDEHDTATALLKKIEHVTRGLALPAGACGSWAALYVGLRKFCEDLVTHIHLENDVLFARFAAQENRA